MTTWLQTHSITHTSLVLPSGTQPKPFSLPSTINLFLPFLINKSPVCASLIFLQPSTPLTTTYYSKDCLPGSVLPTLLSSGFRPISLPALSPLKHQKPHRNHALSPVVFRKVLCLGPYFVHPLHYSTQLTHQSILGWPSPIRWRHPIIHFILSKQLLWLHRSSPPSGKTNLLLDDFKHVVPQPL